MTLSAEERAPLRTALVILEGELAKKVASELSKQLHGYIVDSAKTLSQARKRLRQKKRLNQGYDWLIIGEHIPLTSSKRVDAWEKGTELQFARAWLSGGKGRRAIVAVTDPAWERLSWLASRLSAVPHNGDIVPMLSDMIGAGDAGTTYLSPTVVKVAFGHQATPMKDGQAPLDRCILQFKGSEGPLQYSLDYSRSHRLVFAEKEEVGDFEALSKSFAAIALITDEKARGNAILNATKQLWEELRSSVLNWLLNETEKATMRLFADDPPRQPIVFSPIHLHIEADAEMMAIPLDLALCAAPKKDDHVCSRLPVTWRISSRTQLPDFHEDREWNRTEYAGFRAITSCSFAPGLEEGEKHALDVLKRLGLKDDGLAPVRELAEFCQAIASLEDSAGTCAYVLSQGNVDESSNLYGVAVGPIAGSDREVDIVTAPRMAQKLPFKGRGFIYFNCCHLAYQRSRADSESSYFGGFAEALLSEGVCREIVSHRWFVSTSWALDLAVEFHQQKARTAQGRAHALYSARMRVRDKIKAHDPDPYSTSWMMPIHIWAG